MDTAHLDTLTHHSSPCFTGERPSVAQHRPCAASVPGRSQTPPRDCQGGTAHRPVPGGHGRHDDEPTSAYCAPALAATGASRTTGTSVWLCASKPSEPDPDIPRWATSLVGEYSRPGQRVEVRAAAIYPGLSGEAAALLAASAAAGRDTVAVLPTPGMAARTQTLVGAFTEPAPAGQSARRGAGRRPVVVIEHHEPAVARSVGLLVVLSGPVRPGATPAAHLPGADEALARWVGGLAPGATLVLLCPPHSSRDHATTSGGLALLTDIAARAGLSYAQHVVLVHAPVAQDTLLTPTSLETDNFGPFHPAHTDAFVYTAPATHGSGGAGE